MKAMKSEMRQIHLRDTFEPRHRHELSAKGKAEVLESYMFLKLKRDSNSKGKEVTGVNKQRDLISKEEEILPMVATEAVLISCVIDAQEYRDVSTIDIPNAFIQTCVEKIEDMATVTV